MTYDHVGSKLEDAIIKAAVAWFNSHKGAGMTRRDHLSNPRVNLGSRAEIRLARAVAAWELQKETRRR